MNKIQTCLTGKSFILGSDECGWGCIFGSLIVCGVRAPKNWSMAGLNDSKKLTPAKRESLRAFLLQDNFINYHIAERTAQQIDQMGPYPALKDAFVEVFKALYNDDCLIITDGNMTFNNLGVDYMDKYSEPKADGKYPAVMAASILGKTYRDEMMVKISPQYPLYNISANKGYPNPIHLAAVKKYGYSDLHRKSYEPIKSMVKNNSQLLLPIK